MTVAELIALLQAMPQDAQVVTDLAEAGIVRVGPPREVIVYRRIAGTKRRRSYLTTWWYRDEPLPRIHAHCVML
ncbi:hypothetical protein [Deinococcus peraridilitoris]|uniref:Uncharacterized protein n=1 Tax=Deinococcus peraridilitoris (strain DSM 19664 / LMG 22246 / CIP 109416 / KR-200) TaxID=937777 RepID=K9ZWM3_DEIPD|nr:hypothetical protein [Deinococcus peraridilitoris]AFZ66048.1 hypothetical protein Deipe_0452 [Deinococcus peraridilitoris DSM 19664]